MTSGDETVELEVAFEEALLDRIDRLRQRPDYESRSDVISAAIDAAAE